MNEALERARHQESYIPNDERHCRACRFAGWDPDGNYCAHPEALKQTAFGRSCWSFRREGEPCGPTGALFEAKS